MKKIFLIDYDLCSLNSCGQPCVKKCPISISNQRKKQHQKKDDVPIRYKKSTDNMIIIDELCIKCGICLNVCPRNAIYSIFLLDEPDNELITHEYLKKPDKAKISFDPNERERGFRLFGLPTLLPGKVTGLCGPNGIGKSTVLNILSGNLKMNLGQTKNSNLKWQEILKQVKESEMRHKQKKVIDILQNQKHINDKFFNRIIDYLDINAIEDRYLDQCSGGELQRFAIASVLIQNADCYLIDEPCTFLDVKKRIKLAELLQARAKGFGSRNQYPILVVEHDLAILDYMSDIIHLFYGASHEFGVLTRVQTTKGGINAYLNGFLKTENVQFRKKKIGFKRSVSDRSWENARIFVNYDKLNKTFDGFQLIVGPGTIYEGEILGIVGENGTGKSTFAKIITGELKPDEDSEFKSIDRYVSYKPQYITQDFEGSAKEFIMQNSQNYDFSENMKLLLYSPLGVDKYFETPVKDLSGGQLQRLYIASCLAKRAELYILDEPSAYLDVEERLHISSIIRAVTKRNSATTIVIEHDIAIIDALSDRLLLFTGIPGKNGKTIGPLSKRDGMNEFLKILDITFRRDEETGRARINKKKSSIDKRQRSANEYFYAPRK